MILTEVFYEGRGESLERLRPTTLAYFQEELINLTEHSNIFVL